MKRLRLVTFTCALVLAGCGHSTATAPAATPSKAPGQTATTIGAPATSAPEKNARATASAPTADATSAQFNGYEGIGFGIPEAGFEQAYNGKLDGHANDQCHSLWPAGSQPGNNVSFMFEHGQFVRYDVRTDSILAPGGIKVDSSAAQVRIAYPGIEQQPDKYDPNAYNLRMANPHGRGVLIFQIDKHGNVTQWRAGVPPQVDYVEGCS